VRGNDISMIFQEPMTSLNPLHTVARQIGEVLKVHQNMSDEAARARTVELLTRWASPIRKAGSKVFRTSCRADSASGS
jgi:ABC-type microcin C transport system duplicated ATPase subunit YejF